VSLIVRCLFGLQEHAFQHAGAGSACHHHNYNHHNNNHHHLTFCKPFAFMRLAISLGVPFSAFGMVISLWKSINQVSVCVVCLS